MGCLLRGVCVCVCVCVCKKGMVFSVSLTQCVYRTGHAHTWMLPVSTWPFSLSTRDWEWGRCMGEESGLRASPFPNVDMVSMSEDTGCMLLGGERGQEVRGQVGSGWKEREACSDLLLTGFS